MAWSPPALLALTRGLKEPLAVRNSSSRIHTGGKALLPILTQLASKTYLLPIGMTVPVTGTCKKVVLSGPIVSTKKQKPSLEEASLAGN